MGVSKTKLLLLAGFGAIFGVTMFSINHNARAETWDSFRFTSADKIEATLVNGTVVTFTDSNPGDTTYSYRRGNGCTDSIVFATKPDTSKSTQGTLNDFTSNAGAPISLSCTNAPKSITVAAIGASQPSSTGSASAYQQSTFTWRDSSTIVSTVRFADTWTLNTGTGHFVRANDSDACADYIKDVNADFTSATVVMQRPADGVSGRGCTDLTHPDPFVQGTATITLANVTAAQIPAGESAETPFQSCAKNMDGTGWLVCKMASGADSFVGWVDEQLYKLLRMNDVSANPDLQSGWRSFRNIASGLIILIVLIMVASQIFGFEFMSAYSIKKVLPRLFIAVIAIQLSWILGNALISFFNALGDGVEAILLAPFADELRATAGDSSILTILGKYAESFEIASGEMLLTNGALLGAAALGVIGVGGFWGLAFAAIGLVIVALVAFVTLVLRKIVIIVLLLVMPLALAAWILPNTENLWKKWWSMFSKLLLMYPLVIALLTIGKAFAWMAATGAAGFQAGSISAAVGLKQFAADAGTDLTVLFIILIAYFGPYIFIPSMFKMAGGIFAKGIDMLGGNANKLKGVGPFKRVGEARDNYHKGRDVNRKQANIERANSGNFWKRNYGRFQAGTMGAPRQHSIRHPKQNFTESAYGKQLRAAEQQEAMKNAGLEYSDATKGMEFTAQVADSLAIASAKSGSMVELSNGRSVAATESMRRTSAKFLADTGRSDQLRMLESNLQASGEAGLWNTITSENAGNLSKINPDQMGMAFETLSADSMASMKPGSFRNMKARMGSLEAAARAGDVGAGKKRDAILAQLNKIQNSKELSSKLGDEAAGYLGDMLRGTYGPSKTTVKVIQRNAAGEIVRDAAGDPVVARTADYNMDYAGRTEYIDAGDGINVKQNPAFGKKPGTPNPNGPHYF